jgi:putative Mg2+ transporter-C (MgtC) family protein
MLTGLSSYLPESTLTLYDNLEFLIRLLLSAGLGALVGLERSKRQKEAGVRTHCIIACTSALFMILSKYAFVDTAIGADGLRGADPARIAAQVVSGISFLGAGVIFKNGNSIRGLTTAAGMWGTAAIGMAVGAGMYWLGLIEAAILVAIQIILHRFPVGADALTTQEILVEMEDTPELQAQFDALLQSHNGQVVESSLSRDEGYLRMEITAKLEPPITHDEALAFMKDNSGVRKVSV